MKGVKAPLNGLSTASKAYNKFYAQDFGGHERSSVSLVGSRSALSSLTGGGPGGAFGFLELTCFEGGWLVTSASSWRLTPLAGVALSAGGLPRGGLGAAAEPEAADSAGCCGADSASCCG